VIASPLARPPSSDGLSLILLLQIDAWRTIIWTIIGPVSSVQEATRMLDVLILFPKSADPEALGEFVPQLVAVMKESSGLRSLRLSEGDLMARGAPPPYSTVIEASFDSLTDWMAHVDTLKRRQDFAAFEPLDPLVMFFEAREP
jgi:hypothetical protein